MSYFFSYLLLSWQKSEIIYDERLPVDNNCILKYLLTLFSAGLGNMLLNLI